MPEDTIEMNWTAETLAAYISGWEYGRAFPRELTQAAKAKGLVICWGSSDDLIEFAGVIEDERSAWQGTTRMVDPQGLQQTFQEAYDDGSDAMGALRKFFQREGGGSTITATWCPGDEDDIEGMDGYSWLVTIDCPHSTFEMVEDGEPFCRGIVFSLADTITPIDAPDLPGPNPELHELHD